MYQLKLMNCWTKKINLNSDDDDHVDVVAGSSYHHFIIIWFILNAALFYLHIRMHIFI